METSIDIDLKKYLNQLEDSGCGEILLTSIDREGKRIGFDIDLYQICDELVTIPVLPTVVHVILIHLRNYSIKQDYLPHLLGAVSFITVKEKLY